MTSMQKVKVSRIVRLGGRSSVVARGEFLEFLLMFV